jgi:hypothetical protein
MIDTFFGIPNDLNSLDAIEALLVPNQAIDNKLKSLYID